MLSNDDENALSLLFGLPVGVGGARSEHADTVEHELPV